jgi:cytochrome c5
MRKFVSFSLLSLTFGAAFAASPTSATGDGHGHGGARAHPIAAQSSGPIRNQAKPRGDPDAGEMIFNQVCAACHIQGFDGAPRLGDAAAWKPFIALGPQVMLERTLRGHRAMPPRGACGSCTRQDLADAIAYIIAHSQ